MAERRMFSKTIIDSDAFLDMPLSTQALYFHLSMRADDDGFINNPRKIQRMISCCDDDLKLLIAKNFVIPFESGVCVIKHWRIHNYIRNDRYKETVYLEEKSQLEVKENKAYKLTNTNKKQVDTVGIPDGDHLDTQVRLGKDSIGKDSIDKKIKKKTEYDELIEAYTDEEDLRNTIYEFLKMRKTIKAPMTSNALKLMLNKLDRLSCPGCRTETKINILNQSIMNSWKGIFDIKEAPARNSKSNFADSMKELYEEAREFDEQNGIGSDTNNPW